MCFLSDGLDGELRHEGVVHDPADDDAREVGDGAAREVGPHRSVACSVRYIMVNYNSILYVTLYHSMYH